MPPRALAFAAAVALAILPMSASAQLYGRVDDAFHQEPVPGEVWYLAANLQAGKSDLEKIEALQRLTRFGPAGSEALPAIVGCLASRDYDIRYKAATAIQLIGPSDPRVRAALLTAFRNGIETRKPDASPRVLNAELQSVNASLAAVGASDPEIVSAVIWAIDHLPDGEFPSGIGEGFWVESESGPFPGGISYFRLADSVLGNLTPRHATSIPELARIARTRPTLRAWLVRTIARIGSVPADLRS